MTCFAAWDTAYLQSCPAAAQCFHHVTGNAEHVAPGRVLLLDE